MECIYLHPITEAEKNGQLGHFIKDLIRGAIEPSIIAVNEVGLQSTLPKRLVAGGYPEAFQRLPERAIQWQSQYIQSIIERDIKDIAQVKEGADIKRLLEYVAQQTAQLINVNETAKALGHTRATIDKHLGILEKVFLIRRIKAWHRNTSKRLVKAPKIHICDSGLAAALMGLTQDQWLEQHKQFGFLLESFIVQQLIAQAGWTDPMLRFYHYRDKDQVEVDCVIEKGKKIWGIEIKMSKSIHSKDGQGLRRLHRQAGDDFQQGIIFYDGDSTLQMSKSPNILAVPINELWKR
jgi:predicted AAA+ superfamily ATPase